MSEHIKEFNLDNKKHSLQTDGQAITISDIIKRIDDIIASTQYLEDTLESIKGCHDGNMGLGIGRMIEHREKTNQQIIRFLERMYDDMNLSRRDDTQLVKTKAEIIQNVMNQAFDYEVDNVENYTNAVKELLSHL